MIFFRSPKGASALLAVIVLSAATLLIALTGALTGIQETQNGLNQTLSKNTFFAAEACLEQGLLNLGNDLNYPGETFSLYGVSCALTVSGTDPFRTLMVRASHPDGYVRELEILADVSDSFRIISWREVND